jgi:hypothetical protein
MNCGETGIDCGGGGCPACAGACSTDANCSSPTPFCRNGKCTIEGDVNGDCKVDNADLSYYDTCLGTKVGDPLWNPDCNWNSDQVIDGFDLFAVTTNFGKTCP